ncbi:hypothetical protein [Cyanobium sp. CH-040]|uniref:hypothetical protein n=1 Tax=Cyanobium sp. CH-040 TaxID=2823708 RepID=UPI0020CDC078|nr:hypothetical protein [Cyanobium sp. CH-040]MCP9926873.1 hypothetical protein [Cyanobium sp. CH-040]
MPAASSALISLIDPATGRQRHWWLGDGGVPQRLAGLLGAPLRATGLPPRRFPEFSAVFAPLPRLTAGAAGPAAQQAVYRYLIQTHAAGATLSCWRRYPGGIGWLRRCGPVALGPFVSRF